MTQHRVTDSVTHLFGCLAIFFQLKSFRVENAWPERRRLRPVRLP